MSEAEDGAVRIFVTVGAPLQVGVIAAIGGVVFEVGLGEFKLWKPDEILDEDGEVFGFAQ